MTPAQPEIVAETLVEPVPADVSVGQPTEEQGQGSDAPNALSERATMSPLDLHGRQALLRDLRFLDDL